MLETKDPVQVDAIQLRRRRAATCRPAGPELVEPCPEPVEGLERWCAARGVPDPRGDIFAAVRGSRPGAGARSSASKFAEPLRRAELAKFPLGAGLPPRMLVPVGGRRRPGFADRPAEWAWPGRGHAPPTLHHAAHGRGGRTCSSAAAPRWSDEPRMSSKPRWPRTGWPSVRRTRRASDATADPEPRRMTPQGFRRFAVGREF